MYAPSCLRFGLGPFELSGDGLFALAVYRLLEAVVVFAGEAFAASDVFLAEGASAPFPFSDGLMVEGDGGTFSECCPLTGDPAQREEVGVAGFKSRSRGGRSLGALAAVAVDVPAGAHHAEVLPDLLPGTGGRPEDLVRAERHRSVGPVLNGALGEVAPIGVLFGRGCGHDDVIGVVDPVLRCPGGMTVAGDSAADHRVEAAVADQDAGGDSCQGEERGDRATRQAVSKRRSHVDQGSWAGTNVETAV
ncbi:hypothetical protein ACFWJU_29755 [Streptomyces mutabilis]|uniref:hypothetical protein n=1 Tax=Streptomyces mutabilis TaxID=67332 RepID=UPI00365D95A2